MLFLGTTLLSWGGSSDAPTGPRSDCDTGKALQLAVGEVRTLTTAERSSLCLGGGVSASEYVLMPFNSSNIAATTSRFEITGQNT